MSLKIRKEDALAYHSQDPPGKIEVVPTKMVSSQMDLALAYSPGVAEPCKKIAENKDDVYTYTSKGNLVAVISNGTAVLGLGDIGPEASKPVMEGKGVLFKRFAGIDVFDIEIDEKDPDKFIEIVRSLEPTFGGINLEDIKAPECFKIEQVLREKMSIPLMHDDQHGTAIISSAALLNALEIVNKKIEDIRIVINGAGAAAVACTNLYLSLGALKENIVMCDKEGVIRADREDLDEIKRKFATNRDIHSLMDAFKDADMFLGLSVGNVVNQDMIRAMAPNPIVFALANPEPEIPYELATATRKDLIMATGRSDHPNQVNNVLGFPFIFRGALDVRAKAINEEMKLAAVKAIANLAKQPVPDMVSKAYDAKKMAFGPEYLIPKPLDTRLITSISPAVAKAAMESGVARKMITDWDAYDLELQRRIGIDNRLMSRIINQARKAPKRVVFAEADHHKILKAAQILIDEKIAIPVLLGNKKRIKELKKEYELDFEAEIIDPLENQELLLQFAEQFYQKRKRRGTTLFEARKLMRERNYFGSMLVETGMADVLISGLTRDYPSTIRPALQVIGVAPDVKKVTGMYIMSNKKGNFFFADTTVNENPTAEDLVEIVGLTARAVRYFNVEPRVAMLSYSNFGSAKGDIPEKMAKATRLIKQRYPDLIIDGEMQANTALNVNLMKEIYPFNELADKGANTLIFPSLASGNIAYKLLMEMGGSEAIGPILLGMNKPVHILQLGSSIREIVNMVAIAVVDAQSENHGTI
jgi:malate dehydrogenase (oxaloacetate-decarboxylating)(NADP+)